jgi:hypothetical protein
MDPMSHLWLPLYLRDPCPLRGEVADPLAGEGEGAGG